MPNVIELSSDQAAACDSIMDWWESTGPYGQFRVGGLAGTGKTTIITEVARRLPDVGIAYCAFTGKAAHVLRSKLRAAEIDTDRFEYVETVKRSNDPVYGYEERVQKVWKDAVSTIHGLQYQVHDVYLYRDPKTNKIEAYTTPQPDLVWVRTTLSSNKRTEIPSWVDLIIVDEASMIDKEIWEDMCGYGVPILAVGDHFQLPPVSSDGFSVMSEDRLDVKLERIHRQAERSPIIQVARWAREEHYIPFGSWSDRVHKIPSSEAHKVNLTPDTLVLTGKNRTRVKFNRSIRAMRRLDPNVPVVGDRVVCRKNNHPKRLANGMCGVITHIESYDEEDKTIGIEVMLDHGDLYQGRALLRYFNSEKYMKQPDDPHDEPYDTWDFGYCLTVHCAQGSEARSVVVIEERLPGSKLEHARWLYTAVTRAQEDLLVIG